MSNTFNINRFGLLLRRQWLEFGKIYLISLIVIAGVIITFFYFNIPSPSRFINYSGGELTMNFREPLFLITGFMFLTVMASNYFAQLGQKPRALVELMIPCSILEKFLAGIFYTGIVAVASYVFIFYVIDLSFTSYVKKTFDAVTVMDNGKPVVFKVQTLFGLHADSYIYPFFTLPFAITSIFLLGSVYFNRFHYIKTAISVMIYAGVVSYILYKAGRAIFDGRMRREPNYSINDITQNQAMWGLAGALLLFALIVWTIGYVRLKEKEV